MKDPWLEERIQTSRNLCEISLILIEQDREDLLPTVLELLHYYTQTIIDKHCIKEER